MRSIHIISVVGLVAGMAVAPAPAQASGWLPYQSLDGYGNNLAHPDWGRTGSLYGRTARSWYGDGHDSMVDGPNARWVSNRIFSDTVALHTSSQDVFGGVDVFNETQVSQWGWVWGQFLDHDFGMRQGALKSQPHGEPANITVADNDPMETTKPEELPPGTGPTVPGATS